MGKPKRIAARILPAFVLAGLATGSAFAVTPYTLSFGTDGPLLGTGILSLGAGLLFESGRADPTAADLAALDPEGVPGWDRNALRRWSPGAARASDWLVAMAAVAPVSLVFTEQGRPGELAVMYAETLLLTTGTTDLVKTLTSRPRPYAYGGGQEIPDELRRESSAFRSFPSGHTATVCASLTYWAVVYRDLHPNSRANPVLAWTAVGTGMTVACLRVVSGRHFPSDVVAGAALGTAVGWLVPRLHRSRGPLILAAGPQGSILAIGRRF